MTAPEVNVPLLRKAVEWAEAEAAKPYGNWYQVDTVVLPEERVLYGLGTAGCGTAYCVAGFIAATVTGLDNPYDSPEVDTVCDFAAKAIGVERYKAWALWDMTNSIEDVRRIAEEIAGERL